MSMRNASSPRCLSDDSEHVTSKPFRFKRLHAEDERNDKDKANVDREHGRSHSYRRSHHHKHKRRRVSGEQTDSNMREDGTSTLPPDAAFRESLFDALGDDEGAEFWQGIYGQPIHNYSRTYAVPETGELETMDDEQYAQYVRRKMWEKSAEGVETARQAKRQEQKQEEKRRQQNSPSLDQDTSSRCKDDFVFDFEIEASLRRGQDRKEKKKWQQVWAEYTERWNELRHICESRNGSSADDGEQLFLRNKIAWPVESGKRKDVCADEVQRFVNKVCDAQQTQDRDIVTMKRSILKAERVRWHPDKIQQRYGFMHIEDSTMEGVIAVFQIFDDLWNYMRQHA